MDIEKLADTYIKTAVKLANQYTRIDEFYEQLIPEVARQTGYSKDTIILVQNPIHWALFNREDSPFYIRTEKTPTKKSRQPLNIIKRPECTDPIETTKQILKKYGETLEARLAKAA